jgi:urea carboxylase
MWSRYHQTEEFQQPWLLRFFDQIRFYEVSEEELMVMREDFPRGRCHIRIEAGHFSLAAYKQFLAQQQDSIQAFKSRQQAAFEAERARWAAAGQVTHLAEEELVAEAEDALALGDGEYLVQSHVHGNVWQVPLQVGDRVKAGQALIVIESMKMEIVVSADADGEVRQILCSEGKQLSPGQNLLVLAHHDETKGK